MTTSRKLQLQLMEAELRLQLLAALDRREDDFEREELRREIARYRELGIEWRKERGNIA